MDDSPCFMIGSEQHGLTCFKFIVKIGSCLCFRVSYTQLGCTPKVIRSNNGSELMNKNCREYFAHKGIVHQRTMTYTPQ
ncbi:hypothetical protein V2J09_022828 [Rumex salicifolius]